jgi:hypothetical protein
MTNLITRREALVRAAAAAAGLSLAVTMTAAARRAQAKVEPEPDATADNETLNALLAAEYDAMATYTAGAGIIAADTGTDAGVRKVVTDVAVHFRSQHTQHAEALKKLIEDNAGTPVADSGTPKIPSSFPAAATTTDVMKLATDKEKQAAYTYALVMKTISTKNAVKLVASIGAIETQHFLVLYLLVQGLAAASAKTGMNPTLVVPAAFVLDVGPAGSTNLEKFEALDELLTLDPPA